MEYKFAREHSNYADLASGNVFYSLPGHPAFPIRLASEIFQRCLVHRGKDDVPCTLFDPCCGAAYHLSIIAYLHWNSVNQVICSDIDDKAVQLAERNLGLLTPAGMERRAREISAMIHLYGKDSHKDALTSIHTMQEHIQCLTNVRPMRTRVFRSNATDAAGLQAGLEGLDIDIVFTDIPYGLHSDWQEAPKTNPAHAMLEALRKVLAPHTIVAVASDRQQKIAHEGYQRLEKIQVGKRQVVILRPLLLPHQE
jgi:23S rRNA (guanine2535-N1)-methyltransferase